MERSEAEFPNRTGVVVEDLVSAEFPESQIFE